MPTTIAKLMETICTNQFTSCSVAERAMFKINFKHTVRTGIVTGYCIQRNLDELPRAKAPVIRQLLASSIVRFSISLIRKDSAKTISRKRLESVTKIKWHDAFMAGNNLKLQSSPI